MNSLRIKIFGLITAIVITIVSMAGFITFNVQKNMLYSMAANDARMLTDLVEESIVAAMRSGRSDDVRNILQRIKEQGRISAVRILDEEGMARYSADPEERGPARPEELQAVKSLLQQAATVENPRIVHSDGTLYGTLTLIRNTPTCHTCHEPSQRNLGVLEVEISLTRLNQLVSKGRNVALVSAAIMVALIILCISLFLLFYVERPVRKLIRGMERVEQGDFDVAISIFSSYEMQLLAENFNKMVAQLKELMNRTVEHERELARAEEKDISHQEMKRMNQKLEEQLREIEYLNISLEERIEDIEEANYKIADLAGELEYKNTTLEKAVARLSNLYTVGLAISSAMDADEAFDLIVETTMKTLDAQIGYIILYDGAKSSLEVTTLIGWPHTHASGTILEMKPSSVSTWVIENRRPLLIQDIDDTPQFDRFSAIGYERKTVICAPLVIKDEVIGTITLVNRKNDTAFSAEDLDLLSTIAAQASIAIKNAKLYEEQQRLYLNTIQALVSAIEASDAYTSGHSERVTRYCLRLASRLNLAPDRVKVLERAAILHDIGKIGIDLSLLNKAGKLTPDEVRHLQQHPVIGMKILEPIGFLRDVRLCIGQHHERYDGRGYPCAVSGAEMLLESRILAIADAFDAMVSDRQYRKALPLQEAIRELVENAGSQFDPELVPMFVEVLTAETNVARTAEAQSYCSA